MEGLRQKLKSVMSRMDNLEALVERMRNGTDEESTMLLARLRLGWSVEEMAHAIRTGPAHEGNDMETPSLGFQQSFRLEETEYESLPNQNDAN